MPRKRGLRPEGQEAALRRLALGALDDRVCPAPGSHRVAAALGDWDVEEPGEFLRREWFPILDRAPYRVEQVPGAFAGARRASSGRPAPAMDGDGSARPAPASRADLERP